MNPTELKTIINAGIAAPSADNSQPWLYEQHEDHLLIWIDDSRSGSISDTRFILSDLAVGAAIEHMAIQAQALGYQLNTSYFPDTTDNSLLIAKITWSSAKASDIELAEAICRRHTDRSFPWKGQVSRTVKNRLIQECAVFQGNSLQFIEDKLLKKKCIKLMHAAESLRFRSPTLHQELFSSIKFNAGWKQIIDEGLSPATLAVEPPMRPIFSRLQYWNLLNKLNKIKLYKMLGFRVAVLPNLLSPALGLLCVKSNDRRNILDAGRSLTRLWLRATVENISIQPFAAAGIYALDFIKIEPEFNDEMKKIKDLMAEISNDHGLIFLRIGITQKTGIFQTGRRKAPSFIKQD